MSAERPLSDREVERLLSGREVEEEPALSAFTAALAMSVPAEAPAPNAALAALFETGQPVATPPVSPRRGWRPVLVRRVGVAAMLSLSALVGAASANALPRPAQDTVATVVGWVTPIELPHSKPVPRPTPPGGGDQLILPSTAPTPHATPSPHEQTSGPQDEPSSSPGTDETGPTQDEPSDQPSQGDGTSDGSSEGSGSSTDGSDTGTGGDTGSSSDSGGGLDGSTGSD